MGDNNKIKKETKSSRWSRLAGSGNAGVSNAPSSNSKDFHSFDSNAQSSHDETSVGNALIKVASPVSNGEFYAVQSLDRRGS